MSLDANGAPIVPAAPLAPAAPPAPAAQAQTAPATPAIHYHVAAPTPAAAPAGQTNTAVVAQPDPIAMGKQLVTIPLEQLQVFTSNQARLAEMEAAQRAQQEAAQREQAALALRNGQLEEGMRILREQSDQQLATVRGDLTQAQQRAQNYAIDVEVARALAGHQFVNDRARRQFETEVRSELIADAQGTSFVVRTPTFQSAEQVISGRLGSPEYAYLLAPRGVGGTATAQTAQTPPAPATPQAPAQPEQPRNLGHALLLDTLANAASRPTSDPRTDPSRPMGLAGYSIPPAR